MPDSNDEFLCWSAFSPAFLPQPPQVFPFIFTSLFSTRSHKLIKKFDPFNPKLFKRVTLPQTSAGKWFHVNDSPCQDALLLKRAVFVMAKSPVPICAFQRGVRHLILSARLLPEPVISQGGSCRTQFAFECLHVAFAISEHFKKILVELKELWELEILMHTNDAFSKMKIIE